MEINSSGSTILFGTLPAPGSSFGDSSGISGLKGPGGSCKGRTGSQDSVSVIGNSFPPEKMSVNNQFGQHGNHCVTGSVRSWDFGRR